MNLQKVNTKSPLSLAKIGYAKPEDPMDLPAINT
jgi:hypothetical protein